MGHVSCGNHGCRCCWGCDRCPKCEPETGKIGKGDYCQACRIKLLSSGHVWSEYFQNYVPRDAAERVKEYERRVRALESEGLTRSDAQAVVDAEDAKTTPDHFMTKGLFFDKVVGE